MSDASQGPGWWQASDGRWYPPTDAPAPRPDLPPPPTATPPAWSTTAPAPAAKKPPKKQSTASTFVGAGLGLIVIALVIMCASGAFKSKDTPELPGADASAKAACEHFRNVANDAAKGILGTDQLLPKMREVYNSASVSDNIRVRTAAQQLLAAVTADNDATTQVQAMSAACTAIGE